MATIFVYGTLRPGASAFQALLASRVEEVTPAVLGGFGLRGRGRRYPYVVPAAGERVRGDLVDVADAFLPELDAYEGPEYRRQQVEVEVGGEQRMAWVYVARQGVDVGEPIPSGDWLVG